MIKLVAFDWNGTLLADSRLAAAGDNHAIKKYNGKGVTFLEMQKHFTIPIFDYFNAVGLPKKEFSKHYAAINRDFNEYYESRVSRLRTRGGTMDALKFLKANRIRPIIYSNHVKNFIIKQLKRLDIEKYFHVVLGRGDNDITHMHTRGKQQKLHDYIKQHKFKPREVISVGDTEEEIEIGKHLGYHTVAITGGFNSTQRLKKHHPDFLIHNMKELVGIIKKLNK